MIIFDPKKREAQKQGTFMVYLWSFMTQKARSAKTKNIYVSFIVIFD